MGADRFSGLEFRDPATFVTAKCEDNPDKEPGRHGFLRQFINDYRIDPDDAAMLDEHIAREVDRLVGERFIRLTQFFESCKIPKLVVFSTLVTQGQMKMTDIAEQCGVSKQAIHKTFRAMEPALKPYGEGFHRRRNIQLQKPNGKKQARSSQN